MKFIHATLLAILPLCFCLSQGVDYYWIGGSGEWSEISHWATTSGGGTQHSVLPTVDDNVIFDANSFNAPDQVININRDNVFAASMDWTNVAFNPTLTGHSDYTININGALRFSKDIDFQFEGSFYFSGPNDNIIDFGGHDIGGHVTINGENGSNWILNAPMRLGGKFLFQGGNFNAQSNNISCDQLFIQPKNNSTFEISNSIIEITGGNEFLDPSLKINSNNLSIKTDNSKIVFLGEQSYLRTEGSQIVTLNELVFENLEGNSYIQASQQYYTPSKLVANLVEFKNNAEIFGSNEFYNLILGAGRSYKFENNKTQTITQFTAKGTCSAPINISSSVKGDESSLQLTQNNTLDYINIQDIHANSDANIIANINQATVGGNVEGWDLDLRAANILYWVGGAGNWSDPQHWSLSSGGAGGACIPTFLDDVIFDGKSFVTGNEKVAIDSRDIYFKSMEWRAAFGNPEFHGNEKQNIHIHGSVTLQESMNWDFQGDLIFEAVEETHTIDLKNHMMLRDVFFNGYKATWHLKSNLFVNRRIVYYRSTLYTFSNRIECESFESYGSYSRAIYLENSYFLLRSHRNYLVNWAIEKANFIFDAGKSTIEFTGNLGVFNNNGYSQFDSISYYRVLFNTNKSSSISNKDFKTLVRYASYNSNTTLKGNHVFTRLNLTAGHNYTLGADGEIFEVDTLMASGNCNNPISILSQSQVNRATIRSTSSQSVYYTSIEGIDITGGGIYLAYNAIDLGNNQGWDFEQLATRTLYWVGDSGNWHDPDNWGISSGGSGGECLPTPSDDIVIDQNSFSKDNLVLFSERGKIAICRNFIWEGTNPNIQLNLVEVQVFGSFIIKSDLNSDIEKLVLRGAENHQLNFHNEIIQNLEIKTTGSYELVGQVSVDVLNLITGNLKTNGNTINANYFDIQANDDICQLDCTNSIINLHGKGSRSRGSFSVYGDNVDFIAHGSTFNLTNPDAKLYVHGPLVFDHVLFSAKSGHSVVHSNALSIEPKPVVSFDYLRFRSNGEFIGPNMMDTLIFSSGKGYILESGVEQKINSYWYMRGNNCSQIRLSSSSPGIKSIVVQNEGEIHADFIQMQDQKAMGSAAFNAGINSTDINGSNQGWSFITMNEDLVNGILGSDKSLCKNESLVLNHHKTISAEKYQWNNGSTDESIVIKQTGKYWLKASFAQNCTITDTVLIEIHNELKPNLGGDTTLCAGDQIFIQSQQKVSAAEYSWNDGSIGFGIETKEEGQYILTAQKDQCIEKDTITVKIFDPSEDVIPATLEACENSEIELTIHLSDVDVIWSTGSEEKAITISEEGSYWATIIKLGCSWKDTTIVSFINAPTSVSPDTISICEGERIELEVTLKIPLGNNQYSLFNVPLIDTVLFETQYISYITTDVECTLVDSILVHVKENPYLFVDSIVHICPESKAELFADSDAEQIIWSNGHVGPVNIVDEPGQYIVLANQNGCIQEQVVQAIDYQAQNIGLPPDTLVCYDSGLILDASISEGISYVWSDGSNDPNLTIDEEGLYWVDVDDGICISRDSIEVAVHNCKAIDVFIPNIFSPNGDGNNDELKAFIGSNYNVYEFQMQVFDRWGNKIFESKDIDQGWDGRANGKYVGQQVYVCVVSLSYDHPEGKRENTFSSDVLLNR